MDIVLIEPQIPQNTGSIARTCAATKTPLHLVGRLGFDISEKKIRRAGLDYWPYVPLHQHPTWDEYLTARRPSRIWLIETDGTRLYHQADFGADDALVFGGEVKGLTAEFMAQVPPDQILKIPITEPGVRSLNLSNAVSIVLYEARRQLRLDLV